MGSSHFIQTEHFKAVYVRAQINKLILTASSRSLTKISFPFSPPPRVGIRKNLIAASSVCSCSWVWAKGQQLYPSFFAPSVQMSAQ